jgi:predicted PhzF superfamily epimerase YddE/YHI9
MAQTSEHAPARADAPYDVIDRFFAPGYGIPEDPATGSFHALLTAILAGPGEGGPIRFHQAFPGRGADLEGRLDGDRVLLRGQAVTIAEHRLIGTPA